MLTKMAFRLHMMARAVISPAVLGVAGAVFDAEGRVLLVRHSYAPGWQLPSGGIGRGEHPNGAVRRELAEEVGLSGGTLQMVALYARKAGWVSAPVVFYKIEGGTVNFRPNLEIRAICFADPLAPPAGTVPAALRRLAELAGKAAISPFW
jgi:8-oxo-dGTP pyrophosphatase MutT (NUDIX family)